jgi:hypothetical protein
MWCYCRLCHLSMCAGLQWNIILYADGITPGDAFSPDNNRKAWLWYASFLEMGQKLSNEETWITVAIARTRLPALLCQLAGTPALQAHTRRLQPLTMRRRVRAHLPPQCHYALARPGQSTLRSSLEVFQGRRATCFVTCSWAAKAWQILEWRFQSEQMAKPWWYVCASAQYWVMKTH